VVFLKQIVFESDDAVETPPEKDFFEHVQESIQDLAIDSQACLVDLKVHNISELIFVPKQYFTRKDV